MIPVRSAMNLKVTAKSTSDQLSVRVDRHHKKNYNGDASKGADTATDTRAFAQTTVDKCMRMVPNMYLNSPSGSRSD